MKSVLFSLFIFFFYNLASAGPGGCEIGEYYLGSDTEKVFTIKSCTKSGVTKHYLWNPTISVPVATKEFRRDGKVPMRASKGAYEEITKNNYKAFHVALPPEEYSVSHVLKTCRTVTAKIKDTRDKTQKISVCQTADPYNPDKIMATDRMDADFYMLKDQGTEEEEEIEISKSLVSFVDGSYVLDLHYKKLKLEGVPNKFNCNPFNNLTENQCLVCNCFHEARSLSYVEMQLIGRNGFSRVIDKTYPIDQVHDFGSDICNIVYDGLGGHSEIAPQYSWVGNPEKRNMQIGYSSTLSSPDKAAYTKCVSSVQDVLPKRNEYFASHYVRKDVDGPQWLENCKRRSGKRTVTNWLAVNLAHSFYPVCHGHEKEYLITVDADGRVQERIE